LAARPPCTNPLPGLQSVPASDGADLLPELVRAELAADPDGQPLRRLLFERFGAYPAIDDDHIGEYLPWAAELIGTRGYDFAGHDRRADTDGERVEAWGSGESSVEPLLAEPSNEAKIGHSAAEIMGDVIAGRTGRRPSFIVPNDGYIENLPADAVIEVPGMVEQGVARGVPVGGLP